MASSLISLIYCSLYLIKYINNQNVNGSNIVENLSLPLFIFLSFFLMFFFIAFHIVLFSSVATNLCFGEKNVYTSEVLAVVMQQLMEQTPLPILLMRTVIQSLTMYPRLAGFVMNILARLILKQVSGLNPLSLLIIDASSHT